MKGENNNWETVWVLYGEACLGVDLSKATYISVDAADRKARLSLPVPHVICSKIDHRRSAELIAKQKTIFPYKGLQSLRDEVWKHADEKVARMALDDSYVKESKQRAEVVLNTLFEECDWSFSIEWKSQESLASSTDKLIGSQGK